MTEHVLVRVENRIGYLTLNRARQLNSLSLPMIRALRSALDAWLIDDEVLAVVLHSNSDKAFCAGGDIRFFHEAAHADSMHGSALLEDFFTEEYALNFLLANYPKPTIALLHGIVMGGGMGIGHPARLRIITAATRMAMPEVNIGLFPDVGGTWFLARVPGELGTYLGVTGETIGVADAMYCGMADATLPAPELAGLLGMLQHTRFDDGEAVLAACRALCLSHAGEIVRETSQLALMRPMIDEAFGHESVTAIIHALRLVKRADHLSLAQQALATMQTRSPVMMAVSLEAMRRARDMTLAQALRMERTLVRRCFEHGEVLEGVRALVIDKDNAPRWNPPTLAQVSQQMVEQFFAPAWPENMHPLRDLA